MQSTTGAGSAATAASLNYPRSVWIDSVGALYFAEQGGNCVRKISTANIVVSFAGTSPSNVGNGMPATSVYLNGPFAVLGDSSNNIYITECYGNLVRKVSSFGIISLLAGTGTPSESGNGGPATSAGLYTPMGAWLDSTGVMFISCLEECNVRSISLSGIISRFSGMKH